MTVLVRPAVADQEKILALTRGEPVKPIGLRWPNFVVAEQDHRLIGAVQLRPHRDGSQELGTLVVERSSRRNGIASQLIDALLANRTGRIFIITGRQHADHYSRWGFAAIEPARAPACIRWNYRMGQYAGSLIALWERRAIRRLAILERRSVLSGTATALIDQKIMTAKQVRDVLDDAAIAHRDTGRNSEEVAAHREAVAVIKRLAGSVRKAALPD